ncbi:hypothetical protein K2173_004990 [Erythroxylum novogranatense]|uniref:Gag protein n=1 Tax=Erythroxylum novogranatense TaxID=1862640 RepID=A0AAV8TCN7_9ROSI|nr:hypothetical protein K2173_004990 [Erythroxylum novogranatense]
MKTSTAMVHHLYEMFDVRTRFARVKAIQTFHNLRQRPGEPVRDYMMKVISAVTEVVMLGADMDADKQMIMIINSLNSSFQQFKLDYELKNKDYTLSELMNTLQNTEEILDIKAHGPEANIASSSKPKGKGKEKKKGPMKKKAQAGVKAKPMKKKAKENIKGKCFHCDEMGH